MDPCGTHVLIQLVKWLEKWLKDGTCLEISKWACLHGGPTNYKCTS